MVQIYNTLLYIFTNSLANWGNIADTEIQNSCIFDFLLSMYKNRTEIRDNCRKGVLLQCVRFSSISHFLCICSLYTSPQSERRQRKEGRGGQVASSGRVRWAGREGKNGEGFNVVPGDGSCCVHHSPLLYLIAVTLLLLLTLAHVSLPSPALANHYPL
jgi:hypothetical protein